MAEMCLMKRREKIIAKIEKTLPSHRVKPSDLAMALDKTAKILFLTRLSALAEFPMGSFFSS